MYISYICIFFKCIQYNHFSLRTIIDYLGKKFISWHNYVYTYFFLLFLFKLLGPPGPPGPPGPAREEPYELPYSSSNNMRIVPGAVTFQNTEAMTKVIISRYVKKFSYSIYPQYSIQFQ